MVSILTPHPNPSPKERGFKSQLISILLVLSFGEDE